MKQKLLERIGYSERIERMFGRRMMIALTGQRRVGKSCVMRRILDHIAENEENHVIYIDKENSGKKLLDESKR
ncbi:AAA family ATPase [Prevotella sp.]|uniref:AAA family ATPase n=1 Tax=uncultured Prevotella sp. TaxID=159272 RepID=UPI0025F5FF17|nr:AAA family ATPase [uncultured Prevotella sp.]